MVNMTPQDYASLFDQVARQSPELVALDAEIAGWTPPVEGDVHPKQGQADALRAAIAQCQAAMQASGLTVDVPALRLAEAKAAMWTRIKAERDRRKLEGGYQAAGKWFHTDTFSRTQQMGLVMAGAGIPANTPWKTMDGSFVTMTQTLAGQIFTAAMLQDKATFTAAETHKAAMEASADPLAYDFSGGWPATFGG